METNEEEQTIRVEIRDARLITAFNKITFCGFKKKDVVNEFSKELLAGNIEHSCFWCAELICSGCFKECWDTLFLIYGKYINTNNPKIPIFLYIKLGEFKDIANATLPQDIIELRNNNKVRNIFTETVACFCLSIKDNGYCICIPTPQQIIQPPYENTSTFHLQAHIYKDAPELVFSLHELNCALNGLSTHTTPLSAAMFWIELVMEKGQHYQCVKRETNVGYETHITWAVWELIKQVAFYKKKEILFKTICALESIYKLKFKSPQKIFKDRKFLIYASCAFVILSNNIDWTIPIVHPQFTNQINDLLKINHLHYKKVLTVYTNNINQKFEHFNISTNI